VKCISGQYKQLCSLMTIELPQHEIRCVLAGMSSATRSKLCWTMQNEYRAVHLYHILYTWSGVRLHIFLHRTAAFNEPTVPTGGNGFSKLNRYCDGHNSTNKIARGSGGKRPCCTLLAAKRRFLFCLYTVQIIG